MHRDNAGTNAGTPADSGSEKSDCGRQRKRRRGENHGCGEYGAGLGKLGYTVGLLDADVYGPNVPIMLGSTSEPMATPQQRIMPVDAQGVKMISMGLLNPGDKPVIWRGPMLHSVITQFLRSVDWGELDFLVIDLPPGTGDVQLTLIQTVAVTERWW